MRCTIQAAYRSAATTAAFVVKEIGGSIAGVAFLIELTDLKGRARLAGENIHVVLAY